VIHSLVMIGFFLAGVIAGHIGLVPSRAGSATAAMWVLYALLLLVGVTIGSNGKVLSLLKRAGAKLLLVPASTVVGTLIGAAAASIFIGLSLGESMAVGAGFGYYSLSSILIAKTADDLPGVSGSLAVIALLSNIFREVLTIASSPLLAKYLGGYAPVLAGGATTMDCTLPAVAKYSGSEYVTVALLNGIALTFLVPVLVPLILRACCRGT